MHLPKMEFNAIGLNLPSNNKGKNPNVFEVMLTKKGFSDQMQGNGNNHSSQ